VSYTAFLARLATAIREQQEQRAAVWEARRAEGLDQGYEWDDAHPNRRPRQPRLGMRPNAFTPNLLRGKGARMDSFRRAKKREDLLHMALGVFTSAGIVDLRLPEQGRSRTSAICCCTAWTNAKLSPTRKGVSWRYSTPNGKRSTRRLCRAVCSPVVR